MSSSCLTQVVPCAELYGVSTYNPEEAEDADSVQGGVAASWVVGGGAKNPLAGPLEREDLEEPVHTTWRETLCESAKGRTLSLLSDRYLVCPFFNIFLY